MITCSGSVLPDLLWWMMPSTDMPARFANAASGSSASRTSASRWVSIRSLSRDISGSSSSSTAPTSVACFSRLGIDRPVPRNFLRRWRTAHRVRAKECGEEILGSGSVQRRLDGELSAVRHPLVMLSSSSACPIVASDTYPLGLKSGHPNPRAGDHGLARFTTSKLAISQVPDVLHARLGPATGARSRPVDQRRLRSWVWLPSRS